MIQDSLFIILEVGDKQFDPELSIDTLLLTGLSGHEGRSRANASFTRTGSLTGKKTCLESLKQGGKCFHC